MNERYTVKTGKFGMYFRDREKGVDMSLKSVAELLNELDDFKKYLNFIKVEKFK